MPWPGAFPLTPNPSVCYSQVCALTLLLLLPASFLALASRVFFLISVTDNQAPVVLFSIEKKKKKNCIHHPYAIHMRAKASAKLRLHFFVKVSP